MKSTLKSKALGIMLSALFIFTTQAAAQSDRCFSHEALHTTRSVDIRSDDSYFARYIAKTERNKIYTVITSKKAALFDSCWIEIGDGWLLRRSDSSVIKPGAFEERSPARRSTTEQNASPTPIPSRCYSYSTAYVTGSINIRSGPGVGNSKVGSANTGESFTVSSSQRNGDYCWLKISRGWIAKTGRVSASKPAATEATNSNIFANLNVQGPSSFKSAINKALSLLKNRAPEWYRYVTAKKTTISPNTRQWPYTVSFSELSINTRNITNIWIGSTHDKDTGILAGVLIHEMCHVYQRDEGRHQGRNDQIKREVECMELQVEAMQQASPGHWFIRKIQDLLRNPSRLYR